MTVEFHQKWVDQFREGLKEAQNSLSGNSSWGILKIKQLLFRIEKRFVLIEAGLIAMAPQKISVKVKKLESKDERSELVENEKLRQINTFRIVISDLAESAEWIQMCFWKYYFSSKVEQKTFDDIKILFASKLEERMGDSSGHLITEGFKHLTELRNYFLHRNCQGVIGVKEKPSIPDIDNINCEFREKIERDEDKNNDENTMVDHIKQLGSRGDTNEEIDFLSTRAQNRGLDNAIYSSGRLVSDLMAALLSKFKAGNSANLK